MKGWRIRCSTRISFSNRRRDELSRKRTCAAERNGGPSATSQSRGGTPRRSHASAARAPPHTSAGGAHLLKSLHSDELSREALLRDAHEAKSALADRLPQLVELGEAYRHPDPLTHACAARAACAQREREQLLAHL